MLNIEMVTNPEARAFMGQFLYDREINLEYYRWVPEDQLDYRMVDTPERKSDSPRESLVHQIETENQYIEAARNGRLTFGVKTLNLAELQKKSKDELLAHLQDLDHRLIELLGDESIVGRTVSVPWSPTPVPVVTMLWGLATHEVFHQGWNVAVMDHLNIERFPALIEKWGP